MSNDRTLTPGSNIYTNCLQGLRLIPGTPAFKAAWLKKLRSGEVKQGKGCLRSEDEFCCMGVALNLIDPDGWKPRVGGCVADWHGCDSLEIGMPLRASLRLEDGDARQLATLNDAEGQSFSAIADWIEANL